MNAMAEEGGREVQAEAGRPAEGPALSVTSSGLTINDPWTARIGVGLLSLGAVGLAYFMAKNPETVTKAIDLALQSYASVQNVRPGSILVELSFKSKDNFLRFIDDFEQGKVKEKLEEELNKIGFKDDFKVILNDKEDVYKTVGELR